MADAPQITHAFVMAHSWLAKVFYLNRDEMTRLAEMMDTSALTQVEPRDAQACKSLAEIVRNFRKDEPPATRRVYVCRDCGSANIKCDAWAKWDIETQSFVAQDENTDECFCDDCDQRGDDGTSRLMENIEVPSGLPLEAMSQAFEDIPTRENALRLAYMAGVARDKGALIQTSHEAIMEPVRAFLEANP